MKCLPSRLIYNLLAWHWCAVPCTDCLCNTCFTADSFQREQKLLSDSAGDITYEPEEVLHTNSCKYSLLSHYCAPLFYEWLSQCRCLFLMLVNLRNFSKWKIHRKRIKGDLKYHNVTTNVLRNMYLGNLNRNIISVHRISNGLNLLGTQFRRNYTYRSVRIINSIKKSRS